MKEYDDNIMSTQHTYFIDIDRTILKSEGENNWLSGTQELLPGVHEFFCDIWFAGGTIILTTARPECLREETITQLKVHKLFWNQLVMGIGMGNRYVINDKHGGHDTAFGINVDPNQGLQHLVKEKVW